MLDSLSYEGVKVENSLSRDSSLSLSFSPSQLFNMLKRDDGDEDKELNGGGDFVSNSSDSESEQEDVGKKRTREELEQEEVEALQRDLGEDHREGKRVNRKNTVDKADDENG